MEGQCQGRVQIPGKVGHGDAFPLGQGRAPHVVPGAGTGVALGEFDFPCLEPPGGVLQVQIHAQKVGLPALREGDVRIIVCQTGGLFPLQAPFRNRPGNQVHAVRVHHGHQENTAIALKEIAGDAVDAAALGNGPGQLLGKFQEHRGGDPFVGMVSGGKEHRPSAGTDAQGQHLPAEGGGGKAPAAAHRVGFGDFRNGIPAQTVGHGQVCFDNRHGAPPDGFSHQDMRGKAGWCIGSLLLLTRQQEERMRIVNCQLSTFPAPDRSSARRCPRG